LKRKNQVLKIDERMKWYFKKIKGQAGKEPKIKKPNTFWGVFRMALLHKRPH